MNGSHNQKKIDQVAFPPRHKENPGKREHMSQPTNLLLAQFHSCKLIHYIYYKTISSYICINNRKLSTGYLDISSFSSCVRSDTSFKNFELNKQFATKQLSIIAKNKRNLSKVDPKSVFSSLSFFPLFFFLILFIYLLEFNSFYSSLSLTFIPPAPTSSPSISCSAPSLFC